MLKTIKAGVLLAAATILMSSSANAADVVSPYSLPDVTPKWRISSAAYLWAAGVEGWARTLPPLPAAHISMRFSDVLKNLDGGIMGSLEARYSRFVVFNDIMYTRLSPGGSVNFNGNAAILKFNSGTFTALSAAGLNLIDNGAVLLDAYVGLRAWAMNNQLLARSPNFNASLSNSES